jgi:hypothetical protein
VVDAVDGARALGRERERARRVAVAPERAVQRHQAVAEEARLQVGVLLAERGGHREAAHIRGQRHRLAAVGAACRAREAVAAHPVLVEQVAVAQIGDAGAAQLA